MIKCYLLWNVSIDTLVANVPTCFPGLRKVGMNTPEIEREGTLYSFVRGTQVRILDSCRYGGLFDRERPDRQQYFDLVSREESVDSVRWCKSCFEAWFLVVNSCYLLACPSGGRRLPIVPVSVL